MKIQQLAFAMIATLFFSMQAVSLQAAPDDSVIQDLLRRVNDLGREINELRGENERLSHELNKLKEQQRKGFLSIDERLEKYQQPANTVANAHTNTAIKKAPVPAQSAAAASKSTLSAGATPAKPVATKGNPVNSHTSAPQPRPAANSEKAAYNNAYETLKGNRKAGIEKFTQFLQKYPNSPLAENAHYWIGEAHYAQKNYSGAIDSFIVVLNKYKSGRKAPDAAVKLGYSFYALKDWTRARRTFNDVLRYFPGTNAAKLAQARLDRMRKEGH